MKIEKKLRLLIELASNVMEAFTTAFFIDNGSGVLRLYDYQSFSKEIEEGCNIKEGEGLVGWVKRENKNVLAKHYERSTTTLKFYKKNEEIKSLLAVPIPGQYGVLYVDSKKSYLFTEEKEKIFVQIAQLFYQTIQDELIISKYDLYSTIISLYEKIERIYNASGIKEDSLKDILKSIAEVFNLSAIFGVIKRKYSFSYIFDLQTNEYKYEKYKSSYYNPEGFMGWCIKKNMKLIKNNIIKNRKSFILNSEEPYNNYTNFLGIPFKDVQNNLGSVGFVKRNTNEYSLLRTDLWEEREVEVLRSIINRIGM